jgi:hypothetical protein
VSSRFVVDYMQALHHATQLVMKRGTVGATGKHGKKCSDKLNRQSVREVAKVH